VKLGPATDACLVAVVISGGNKIGDEKVVVMHFVFQNTILVPWGDAGV